MSEQVTQRLVGLLLMLVGITLLLGLVIEPFPVVGGKITIWSYNEVTQPDDCFESIPGVVAIITTEPPPKITVVTNTPISDPSACGLSLKYERRVPALFVTHTWLLITYIVTSVAFAVCGAMMLVLGYWRKD